MKSYKSKILLLAICALPILGSACPMCQAGATKRTQKAYLQTTAILALIPLLGGGSIFYWFYSKGKKLNEENK
jgi:hypothetical protein